MKVPLPQYNGKDNQVMLLVMPLFSLAVNCFIFGWRYFTDWKIFIAATLITIVTACLYFICCGIVAVAFKNHLPAEADVMKRLALMILTFLLLGGLVLYFLFKGYESISFFHYEFDHASFVWSYFSLGILNIFVTFLMEGIARYQAWEKNRVEAEDLHRVYKQSQLQGLKAQVNSHFLFNSLNTLASLIHEDEGRAELFLDEMSKVYRYLLRNDEQQLVPLETELKFARAYIHLLKARYGDGLIFELSVHNSDLQRLLAPLTLQVIIENTFSQNIVSRSHPLTIVISSNGQGQLSIRNNLQPKIITNAIDFETGLDNLVTKYQLFNQPVLVEDADRRFRRIIIPLFNTTSTEVEA